MGAGSSPGRVNLSTELVGVWMSLDPARVVVVLSRDRTEGPGVRVCVRCPRPLKDTVEEGVSRSPSDSSVSY